MNLNKICAKFFRNFDRKIYKCQKKHDLNRDICDAIFNQKFNLKKHQFKKNQNNEVTIFVHCASKFKQRKNIHLKSTLDTLFAKSSIMCFLIRAITCKDSNFDNMIFYHCLNACFRSCSFFNNVREFEFFKNAIIISIFDHHQSSNF